MISMVYWASNIYRKFQMFHNSNWAHAETKNSVIL
jgi:hypothetical protein